MDELARLKYLSWVLRVFGVIAIGGVFLMTEVLDAESWTWEPRQSEYEQMIMGIYAVLGVFLLMAARDPMRHRSLIQFTAWSSLVHGGIMLVQALVDDGERANLFGDVPALILIGIVLWWLLPRAPASVETASIADR